jgi:L-ascorbate metabolism protein UlaG (beta-lactamase superfamily)
MNPRTAALACRTFFDFSAILPCHYKTFPMLMQSADSFVEAMGDHGHKVKVLNVGESISL